MSTRSGAVRPSDPETGRCGRADRPGQGVGHPATSQGWGLVDSGQGDVTGLVVRDLGSLFGLTEVRWYPVLQWFDGAGFADLLRSTSLYRRVEPEVREPLPEAIAEWIRKHMDDRVRAAP